jgi:transposase
VLTKKLYPKPPPRHCSRHEEPDWLDVHQEVRKKGVSLILLWEEYRDQTPESHYSYSQYCANYNKWVQNQMRYMRQSHKAGEKLFLDYVGLTIPIVCGSTGECREAQIFVAVMGASNYTYAQATWTQQLPDWLGSHVRAFNFFGGVPELLIPDNLRSAVPKACRYDPAVNPRYQQLAASMMSPSNHKKWFPPKLPPYFL